MSFEKIYSLFINGCIKEYKTQLNRMNKLTIINYLCWLTEIQPQETNSSIHHIKRYLKKSWYVCFSVKPCIFQPFCSCGGTMTRTDNYIRTCFPKLWDLVKQFKCPICQKDIKMEEVVSMKLDELREFTYTRTCKSCCNDIKDFKRRRNQNEQST